jgi:hypothetical protein
LQANEQYRFVTRRWEWQSRNAPWNGQRPGLVTAINNFALQNEKNDYHLVL